MRDDNSSSLLYGRTLLLAVRKYPFLSFVFLLVTVRSTMAIKTMIKMVMLVEMVMTMRREEEEGGKEVIITKKEKKTVVKICSTNNTSQCEVIK